MAHRKQIKINKSSDVKQRKATSGRKQAVVDSEPQQGTSSMTNDRCIKCVGGDCWIQCDFCNGWWHRKCAGLQNAR